MQQGMGYAAGSEIDGGIFCPAPFPVQPLIMATIKEVLDAYHNALNPKNENAVKPKPTKKKAMIWSYENT